MTGASRQARPAPPQRLGDDEAARLLRQAGTAALMARADRLRRQRHGARTFFVHSLNLNPTNVCENRCDLCAFWREAGAADAFLVTLEQARQRMRERIHAGDVPQ